MTRQTASSRVLACALSVVAFCQFVTKDAHADVSSWLSVGAGASKFHGLGMGRSLEPSLRLTTGMGTDPARSWVLGVVGRSETYWGSGTDLSLSLRFANHGFANGGFGFAFDAGPLARFWGRNCYGGTFALSIGAPWGLEGGLQTVQGGDAIRTYGVFVAMDLARLTIYRRSGSSYWKNSFPAYRPLDEQR